MGHKIHNSLAVAMRYDLQFAHHWWTVKWIHHLIVLGLTVCRIQLQDQLKHSRSKAESAEIVEKLKKVEQEMTAMKTPCNSQQGRGERDLQQTGMPALWTYVDRVHIGPAKSWKMKTKNQACISPEIGYWSRKVPIFGQGGPEKLIWPAC